MEGAREGERKEQQVSLLRRLRERNWVSLPRLPSSPSSCFARDSCLSRSPSVAWCILCPAAQHDCSCVRWLLQCQSLRSSAVTVSLITSPSASEPAPLFSGCEGGVRDSRASSDLTSCKGLHLIAGSCCQTTDYHKLVTTAGLRSRSRFRSLIPFHSLSLSLCRLG